MTPSPILKVLSPIRRNGVRSLLMGGQACVVYGGAEFSRDTDIMVVADAANLTPADAIDVLSLPDLVTAKKTSATRTGR